MGQGGRDLTLAFALHEVEEGREPLWPPLRSCAQPAA